MSRREYNIEPIRINRIVISKVIIDTHFELKHSDYINDELILNLVALLDHRIELPEAKDDDGHSYFATLLELNDKQYRLIWLLENNAIYIGIINAYRDNRKE